MRCGYCDDEMTDDTILEHVGQACVKRLQKDLAAARAEVEQAYRAGYHAYDVECGCPIESVDIENAAAAWSRYQQEK